VAAVNREIARVRTTVPTKPSKKFLNKRRCIKLTPVEEGFKSAKSTQA
jgi:hypothetical protein